MSYYRLVHRRALLSCCYGGRMARNSSGILLPSKRAGAVALCWLVWFLCHVTIEIRGGHLLILHDNNMHIAHQIHGASSSGYQRQNNHIEAKIVHNLPVHGLHADGSDVQYRCKVGEVINLPKRYKLWGGLNGTRQPLQYPLNQSGVLDFAVHISDMKLKVLIVGNSLGEQLHAGLEEAMCYPINMTAEMSTVDRKLWAKQVSTCKTIHVENTDAQWIKEPRIVTTRKSSGDDGGMLAVIKDNTNMIDTNTKWNLNNTAISSIVQTINKINNNDIDDNDQNAKRKKQLLDVLIYQFQSGHIDLQNFDEYYLEQAILAASNIFQASTVIFPTIAWMNNVNRTRVTKLHDVNERIRNFAKMYIPTETSTVDTVQVLDIAQLSTYYIEENAKILNIPSNEVYTLRIDNLFESLVAQMCASLPFDDDPRGCLPGMVSVSPLMCASIYILPIPSYT